MMLPPLLLVTDRAQLRLGRSLVATVAECLDAGATHVLLRELDLSDEHRAALARALADLGATVVAGHRPLPGAVGVHLPSGRPATAGAPGVTAASAQPWGRSCHTVADVSAAAADGAGWVTLGPFAATPSKPGYGPPVEPAGYAGHDVPVYALGGIGAHNAGAAVDAGAHGVAVMGAVMRAEAPGAVVRDLLAAVG